MRSAPELVNAIAPMVGCGYALGSQGELLTKERLAQLVRWNGRSNYYFTGYSAEKWIGKRCFDCSGLIVWAMQQLGVYAQSEDYKAQGLWTQKVSPITAAQLQPGSLCFRWDAAARRMSHVGVYLGNNRVQEAKGTKYGVVVSALPGSWTHYGDLKGLGYAAVAAPPPAPTMIYKGSRGGEVRQLQTLLNARLAGAKGFVPLVVDGIFGNRTDAAVRSYQKACGLQVDGIVGPLTWGSLLS